MRQLPHSVALQKKHADNLVVITVNFDEPNARADVLDLLRQAEAAGTINLMSRSGASDEAFERFDIPDGALPHYKVVDRQGKLFESLVSDNFDQPLTPERIDATVAAALADGAN